MNPTAANQRLDDLDGLLRAAVEQIVSIPPPAESMERILHRAARLSTTEMAIARTPSKTGTRLCLASAAALVILVMLAVGYATLGGWFEKKPMAGPTKRPAGPTASPEVARNAGVTPAAPDDSPDMRLGARAFGASAGLGMQPGKQEEQPVKTDQQRLLGNWFIVNDDSLRRGEMWVISEDRILMHAKNLGANAQEYLHRLDAAQDPKQIDITVTKVNGPAIGIIKSIYALEGDELRLCLAEMDKERPAAFPEKPAPGQVLVLHRQPRGAGAALPKANDDQPAARTERKEVLTPAEAIALRSKESVTVQFKVAGVEAKALPTGGFGTDWILLRASGSFSVRLDEPARAMILRLGIEPEKYFPNKVIRAMGIVEPNSASSSFQIRVKDLTQFLVLKDQAQDEKTAKTDQERLVGGWVIGNEESKRQGEPWIVDETEIVMYANLLGVRVERHFHLLDPTKSPKQIDIAVTKTNLEFVGVIKGIYELDSDAERLQWRLCLGEIGKDRPAAFPEKPAPGEVLILHHAPEPQAKSAPKRENEPAK